MRVLVIGSGGREHALAWRLAQDPRVSTVFVAPGNAGTALTPKLENLAESDLNRLADFAATQHIDFTLVGPEAPLAAGIVNLFREKGLRIFGPTREAAQLESSKDFAKAFMKRHGIPTADYETFTDATAAHAYVSKKGAPIVIKADGLAAGKGVIVAMTEQEAHQAVDEMLEDNRFGSAGARVVIEDFLVGEEASFIVMVDGDHVLPMASSQDHKRLLDHDQGPNTGGMGAYSPAPVVTPAIHEKVMNEIILPTVRGMAADGIPFTGFLYAGLMIRTNPKGETTVKTLEFNCRMGDPETQPIMSRLQSPLADLCQAAIDGKLNTVKAQWDERVALGVVCASRGYPEKPEKGAEIVSLPTNSETLHVFHAGTKNVDGKITVSGGRVLCVVGLGENIQKAAETAYHGVDAVRFEGMQYRHDIGYRAMK